MTYKIRPTVRNCARVITGSPNGPVLFCMLSSVGVCRRVYASSSVTQPVGGPAGHRARENVRMGTRRGNGRVGGRAADTARRASTVTLR